MDPNPNSFPVLSYVMSKLPFSKTSSTDPDIEQPSDRPSDPFPNPIESTMPQITDPKMLKHMTIAISDVAQARSVLQALGDRPDHESVDRARAKIAEIETTLAKQLEEIVLSPRPPDVDRLDWRGHLSEKENEIRDAAMKERKIYESIIQLDEMHDAYEKMLRESEEKLMMVYRKRVEEGEKEGEEEDEIINEEVVGILGRKDVLERVDLSGKRLKFVPEEFGRIKGLVSLNLSNNQLEMITDSIAGLEKLEELNLSSNLLEALPDSIGLLHNLKILNVSGNKLHALPDSICHCRSLVELDVSFNNLTYLPTNIGYELVNLRKLLVQLNKIRNLPTSVCEMRYLCFLDAHFNELRGLPHAIGRLTNLEVLNLSSNFSDMTELPDTIGDLVNLKELDLSNNQIHALPDTFGRLEKLTKFNLDQNPIVIPPLEVVNEGVEAVKMFMTKRWIEILVEEERKSQIEMKEEQQTGWLTRSTSWLNHFASGVSESVSVYLSPRAPRDPLLDQQL